MTRVGLVGRGRAAGAIAIALEGSAGIELAWQWSHRDPGPAADLPGVEVVLLAVPDAAIEAAAGALLTRPGAEGEVWLHLSGSRPGSTARVSPDVPRAVGCLHPLMALAGPPSAPLLVGAMAGLDGEPEALAAGEALARALGLRPRRVDPARKALYHVAAVTAAGHVVALMAQATELMTLAGIAPEDAKAALLALARGALDNLVERRPDEALTGPIDRGDLDTVRAHLEALMAVDRAELTDAYRSLGLTALDLARGHLDPARASELERLLRRG